MVDTVVIKLGGGLITNKQLLRTPRLDIIEQNCKEVQEIVALGYNVILVHGAGSYGHLLAKEFRIGEGYIEGFNHTFSDCNSQEEAVEKIRIDMLDLNQYLFDELSKVDITCVTLPPHTWAKNTGKEFEGSLEVFESTPHGIVAMCYGDVVECDGESKFGILSGDDLVYRLSAELPNVVRVIFALGGVDGVLERPPADGEEQLLIPLMSPHREFSSIHDTEIDVTGGISLKVNRSFELAKNGIEVTFVNGAVPGRIVDAAKNEPVIGTKFALFPQ